jgi:excisionase family DNA binding protein
MKKSNIISNQLPESYYLNYLEAAQYLGVAPSTIRKWVFLGKVPYYKIGTYSVRFIRSELDQVAFSHGVDNESNT